MNHWIFRYALSLILFGLIIGLSLLLSRYGIKINLTIPVVLALVAAAWYGGRGPGILISVLFQSTTIYYVPIPPDSTLAKAAFGWFSVFALYIFMVFLISRLRMAQQRLSEQRDLLQVTLSSIGDGVITTDTTGVVTFMNPVASELTGWEESEAQGQPLDKVFSIADEETGQTMTNPVSRMLQSGATVGLTNHTVLRSRNGREVPIDDSAAPIKDREKVKGVVLVFSDVTVRKNAERARRETEIMHRIVAAQEAERQRIARDLHDHLGQKMTALRFSIEGLTDHASVNGLPSNAIVELQASASNIDRDIGFLSWELRPTELENLGLDDALSSFVREWATHYGIDAEFHSNRGNGDREGARLPETVETNIYRIVQEALNNVLKHADAKKVSVLLQEREGDLVLIVEDDGRGFEGGNGSNNGLTPKSLGIVGMQERAALLKGTLEIESQPGAGTTILARIPLQI
ncbi:hypothetical protein BH20ACI2_BH20ACI2_18500 [soil metagenome]